MHRIDICFIQEHNIKDKSKLEYLEKFCNVLINHSICQKGGTAILIKKNSNVDILNCEYDVNGSIISAKCKYSNTVVQLINVYAPSGTNKKSIREELFQNDLLFYLRNNMHNVIIGGDWNCITSGRDCSNPDNDLFSPALTHLKNTLKLKDVWFLTNHDIEFTYFRHNYGSRLDRLYVRDLQNHVTDTQNIPISCSDHCMIKTSFRFDNVCTRGKGYWKLNCNILKQDIVKDNFRETWNYLKKQKSKFICILEWWSYVKEQLKSFFIKASKLYNQEKYGLLDFLRSQLKDVIVKSTVNTNKYEEIDMLKSRINVIQDNICEGIRIRAKVDEKLNGEKVSSYLIGREKNSRSFLDKIITSDGVQITETKLITSHVRNHYENLFKEE